MRLIRFGLLTCAAFVAISLTAQLLCGDVLRIMPLGDSITSGFAGPPEVRGAYRLELEREFLARGFAYNFVGDLYLAPDGLIDGNHHGFSGYSIEQMSSNYGDAIARHLPDVVLVLAGTNNHFNAPDFGAFVNRYESLVSVIRTNAPQSQIVFSTVPKFDYHRDNTFYWTQEFVDFRNNVLFPVMNAAIYDVASRHDGIQVVDLYSILDPAVDIVAGDGQHPNRLGHVKLAGLFAPKILAIPEPGAAGLLVVLVGAAAGWRRQAVISAL